MAKEDEPMSVGEIAEQIAMMQDCEQHNALVDALDALSRVISAMVDDNADDSLEKILDMRGEMRKMVNDLVEKHIARHGRVPYV